MTESAYGFDKNKIYKAGDIIPESRTGFPNESYIGCRFCGGLDTGDGTMSCGYRADYLHGGYQIKTMCSKYQNEKQIVSSHSCNCSILKLLREGCSCGGV